MVPGQGRGGGDRAEQQGGGEDQAAHGGISLKCLGRMERLAAGARAAASWRGRGGV
jgi:hypothetical protein